MRKSAGALWRGPELLSFFTIILCRNNEQDDLAMPAAENLKEQFGQFSDWGPLDFALPNGGPDRSTRCSGYSRPPPLST